MSEKESSPWAHIKPKILEGVSWVPVDLYLKLSEVKYIKIYRKEDKTLEEVITKYSAKEIEKFYCRKNQYELLTTHLFSNNTKVKNLANVELVNDLVRTLGVSEAVVSQIDDITKDNLKELKGLGDIGKFLENMLGKGDRLSQHSMMVSFFSCLLAKQMGWNSPQVLSKLSFSGILHDVTLSSDILLNLTTGALKDLGWKIQKTYGNHIQDTIAILEKV